MQFLDYLLNIYIVLLFVLCCVYITFFFFVDGNGEQIKFSLFIFWNSDYVFCWEIKFANSVKKPFWKKKERELFLSYINLISWWKINIFSSKFDYYFFLSLSIIIKKLQMCMIQLMFVRWFQFLNLFVILFQRTK